MGTTWWLLPGSGDFGTIPNYSNFMYWYEENKAYANNPKVRSGELRKKARLVERAFDCLRAVEIVMFIIGETDAKWTTGHDDTVTLHKNLWNKINQKSLCTILHVVHCVSIENGIQWNLIYTVHKFFWRGNIPSYPLAHGIPLSPTLSQR